MEQFFGGNPALVLVRLAILSLIVGVVLAALGFSPLEIIDSITRLVERIYDLGFVAIEKAFRYFLLGAVIVFPIWLVVRLLKFAGRPERRSGRPDLPQARGLDEGLPGLRGFRAPFREACRARPCRPRPRSAVR